MTDQSDNVIHLRHVLEDIVLDELKSWIKEDVNPDHYKDLFWSWDYSTPHTQTIILARRMARACGLRMMERLTEVQLKLMAEASRK